MIEEKLPEDIGAVLRREYAQLQDRYDNPKDGSSTTKMFQRPYGVERKLNEEVLEVAQASMTSEGKPRQVSELADMMYAAVAYMVREKIPLSMLASEMASRQK